MTDARPIAMPASTRQIPSSQIVVGNDEPTALTANNAAAMCMTHSRPAGRHPSGYPAPTAEPSRATATTVPVSPTNLEMILDAGDGAIDDRAVVSE